eukprot:CAMPEP_0201513252 /NCGR_PEP_ID=MMETSP0161_2-20130828/5343_1 /ASSEMBLY_ACC=CAM_ASM_000251 /TAXON_ID=180227 /ORGANISM="Neoparamoeba aestuarina, Strain SoJaBio B1-5/56/2" /LENGTH=217 /DNA_ID=CAMNT_0047909389 /DNA_START=26 /DNA_END=679 /DNA_ORIENTATION=-
MSLFSVFLLRFSDPLGRADPSTFSQEAMMVNFLSGFTKNANRIRKNANYDIWSWKGLKMDDREEDIWGIRWANLGLEGSVELKWLPRTVDLLMLAKNSLSGSIDLSVLPVEMEVLDLSSNMFLGEVCLKNLPVTLNILSLHENRFCGAIDVSCLPLGMNHLTLGNNMFEGHTDFSKLPDKLNELDVSHTKLSGEIYVDSSKSFCTEGSDVKITVSHE